MDNNKTNRRDQPLPPVTARGAPKPMDINSQAGQQDIDHDTVITLPGGMLGFEDLTRFKLYHEEGKPTVFWLQSLDDPQIRFSVADPALFNVAYQISLSDEDLAQIGLENAADLAMLVTVAKTPEQAGGLQANFMAPVLINTEARLGIQKPLNQVESQVVIRAR